MTASAQYRRKPDQMTYNVVAAVAAAAQKDGAISLNRYSL